MTLRLYVTKHSYDQIGPVFRGAFKYPDYVRKAIYTTIAVEAVHRQCRKLTKTNGGFRSETSLLKRLGPGRVKASGAFMAWRFYCYFC